MILASCRVRFVDVRYRTECGLRCRGRVLALRNVVAKKKNKKKNRSSFRTMYFMAKITFSAQVFMHKAIRVCEQKCKWSFMHLFTIFSSFFYLQTIFKFVMCTQKVCRKLLILLDKHLFIFYDVKKRSYLKISKHRFSVRSELPVLEVTMGCSSIAFYLASTIIISMNNVKNSLQVL